ncbi:hypothetical protein F4859DRAFT_444602 [Xylaria cf. heliscus]|nr:hypothetical protein F4859DRAFT_444602 [Xylaria cf. heliscus]
MASSGSGPPQPPVSQPAVTQPPAPQPAPGRVDNRPLSPWAERYGYGYSQDIWPTEPVRHSNIAPSRNPPLHPKFYGDEPSEEGHGVFSSGYDKDRFFVTEYRSKSLRRAVESWQYGPLTRTLQFSDRGYVPGGHVSSLSGEAYIHRLIYETERIQVNEDSWFPFFKKNRWYSTAAYEPLLTGNSWSVDDPIIWGELSVALELANRILNTLIHDKHIFLQTILFGKLAYWEKAREYFPEQPAEPVQDATVLLSYPFYKARFTQVYPDTPCEMDHVMDLTNDQYRDMLCLLGSQQDWSLASLNFGDGDRSGGRTVTTQILNNFIMIDVDPIKSLIRNDLTLAERVAAMYELSNTILHELCGEIFLLAMLN